MGELTTSNKLGQAEAKLITDSIEADTSATSQSQASTGTEPPSAVATTVSAPATVSPTPTAAATPSVPTASEDEELARLRTENAQLRAKVTPGLAAAVPTEDATQSGRGTTADEGENAHFANLKRIKEKYSRFGLTAEIDLGE